jgi:hypothetical protein
MKCLPNLILVVFIFISGILYNRLLCAEGEKTKDDWQFTVAPYAWLAAISGNVTVMGKKAASNLSIGEELSHLDFAGMVYMEAQKGRWGLFLEPNYIKLSADGSVGLTDVKITMEEWLIEFGGFYRLGKWDIGNSGNRTNTLDVILGGRYTSIETSLDVKIPTYDISDDVDITQNIIDPIIGGRFNIDFTEKFHGQLRGDIGGFGISNNSSKLSWQVIAILGYDLSKWASVWGGYRLLATDFSKTEDNEKNGMDIMMQGPIAGLAIKF